MHGEAEGEDVVLLQLEGGAVAQEIKWQAGKCQERREPARSPAEADKTDDGQMESGITKLRNLEIQDVGGGGGDVQLFPRGERANATEQVVGEEPTDAGVPRGLEEHAQKNDGETEELDVLHKPDRRQKLHAGRQLQIELDKSNKQAGQKLRYVKKLQSIIIILTEIIERMIPRIVRFL